MGMVSDGLPNGHIRFPSKILFDRLGADMASAACCRCRDAESCTAAASATGALLAPTAPRRAARLRYVPRALWRGGWWWYRGLKGEQGASEAGSAGCRRSERYVWLLWAGSTLLLCGEGCFAGP